MAGCAATSCLAPAGSAFALSPQLVVSGATATGASAQTLARLKGSTADAATASLVIYVPGGYVTNVGQPAGTQIGTVAARAQLLEASNTILDASGTILVADRTAASVRASATDCTGTPAHDTVWQLHIVASVQTVDFYVYVDRTAGADASFGSAQLVLCLPNPYAQAAPGTHSPNGMKIFDAKVTMSAGVFTNPTPAGTYVWHAVVTPWTVDGAIPNPAGALETQGVVAIPSSLSLRAKVRTVRHRTQGRTTVANSVLLSGKLLESLRGVGGAKVAFFANGKSAGSATTASTGSFSKSVELSKKASFHATATVAARETPCLSPLPAAAPAGCVSATWAGYKIRSNSVAVTPRER
jgi:hypothetical protein